SGPATPDEPGKAAGGRRSVVILDTVGGEVEVTGGFAVDDLPLARPLEGYEEGRHPRADDGPGVPAPTHQQGLEDRLLQGNLFEAGSALRLLDFRIDGATHVAGSRVELPGQGSLVLHADGRYAFIPAPDWNGSLPEIHYRAESDGQIVESSLRIDILPANDAPASADVQVSLDLGQAYRFSPEDFPFDDARDAASGQQHEPLQLL